MTSDTETIARDTVSSAEDRTANLSASPTALVPAPSIVPQGGGKLAAAFRQEAYALDGLVAEWRPLTELAAIDDAWRALAARSLEQNVFYEPDFALAAAPVFGARAGAVLIWAGAARRQLVGLFPARVASWRSGFPLSVTLGWTHPYAPLGTPLVDRDNAPAIIGKWLDFVAQGKPLPRRILLPFVPTEGPFALALGGVITSRGQRHALFAPHQRALLAPLENRDGYLAQSLAAKKRKELARQRRRLGEEGAVESTLTSDQGGIGAALDDFMALEQRGWKGRGGSAAAQDAAVSRFMRTAIEALAARGQASVARLTVGGRVIAAGILLRSGATGWFWKIAYDEDAARASPGVQLALDLTQTALEDVSLMRVDSCATAGHPMIDHLWGERLALADILLAVGARPTAAQAFATRAEGLRRAMLAFAKWLRQKGRGAKR